MSEARCSELSASAGESLAATATNAERWLLIEVPGSWSRDVSAAAGLPGPAQDAAVRWLERTPASRVLFVRRPSRSPTSRLVFVVHAGEHGGDVRRVELDRPEDLAGVDLAVDGDLVDGRLVLVCGHGSRDRCCALEGTAVYGALEPTLPEEELWISSHHGGHRFAANVLVLPGALHFGRVRPEEAPRLVAAALAGRIDLARYRGRTAYEPIVQAAELRLREHAGLDGVTDLGLVGVEEAIVRFRARDGREHTVAVEEVAGPTVPASCGAEPEAQTAFRARLGGPAPSFP